MPVVGVVRPVADPPAVVWHQDGAVCDVADQVIDLPAIGEALVPTARCQIPFQPLHSAPSSGGLLNGVISATCSSKACLIVKVLRSRPIQRWSALTSHGPPQRGPRTWCLALTSTRATQTCTQDMQFDDATDLSSPCLKLLLEGGIRQCHSTAKSGEAAHQLSIA